MSTKTYRAKNMHEAIAMIHEDFGPDATLLQSREVRKSRFFGLFRKSFVEVTATDMPPQEEQVENPAPTERFAHPQLSSPMLFPETSFFDRIPSIQSGFIHENATANNPFLQKYPCTEMDIPAQIQDLLLRIFSFLCDLDMDEVSARMLIAHLKEEVFEHFRKNQTFSGIQAETLQEKLFARVLSEIRTTGPIAITPGKTRIAALVGPTGVGKTTTIAKLAACYRLQQNKQVGLITLDTYRMAAVEQLQTYANVIGIPMQVVSTPRQIREAIQRMDGFDLILMDTAGRSSKEEIRIQELRAFLEEAEIDEVHLVLSSTARSKVLQQTAEKFSVVGTNALIITKLDESMGLGNLFPLIRNCGLPVSYVTNGQNVPDDFEVAREEQLARWILGEEQIGDSDHSRMAQWG